MSLAEKIILLLIVWIGCSVLCGWLAARFGLVSE
jgi:DNA-binding transcriptional regulator of glucitol operon